MKVKNVAWGEDLRNVMDEVTADSLNEESADRVLGQAEEGTLEFSVNEIILSVTKGQTVEGSFRIYTSNGLPVEGYVYSSALQMKCPVEAFMGISEEIPYLFDSVGMEEGEIREGFFAIVSNYGEYEIPYRVMVDAGEILSGLGPIKNMFHFANLAKTNWEEALKLFYSKEFERLFKQGTDKQYYSAYKGLSAMRGNEQNMEEFLLEINKKQQVMYEIEQTQIRLEEPVGVAEYSLIVERNGWGYTFLQIEAEGEFLQTEREWISDDEFLGNSYRLVYYVDSEKLHAGNNYGSIRLFNTYVDMTIAVTVVCSGAKRKAFGITREKKKIVLELMEAYCNYRGKRISTRIWMGETQKLVERLAALDAKDVQTRLFQAQLFLTQERYKEAKWQLDKIKNEVDLEQCKPEIGCYYLYLTTLLSEDDEYVDAVAMRVTRTCQTNPGNWRIAWLMLHLSEEYAKSFSKRWLILEEQFRRNCTSPVLYVEAWHLLELNPTLLMKLGAFEMQVLTFAAKRELLSQDIVVQIRFQIQKLKEYSKQAFYILKECYEKYPDAETLQEICTLLIKGNRTDKDCFEWYSMGVEQELRITKLYEYYMMSLPEDYDGEIPKMVLLYFAYQSDLDYRKNAFLYAYVYKNREEQPEHYIKFCTKIESFVLTQLKRGRICKELAYLYQHILNPRLLNEERAKELLPLIFTHRIRTEHKGICQVIVRYVSDRTEYRYPMSDGEAYVPLYGEDYKILLEDGEGGRYTVSVPYRTERFMDEGKWLPAVMALVPEHEGLDLYLCESSRFYMEISAENVHRFRHMADSQHMETAQRNEICLKLLHFYYEQDYMQELDEYLSSLTPEGKRECERSEILRVMVARGMYDKAFEWMKQFGIGEVDNKTLVRLCSRLIARDGLLENTQLTRIIYDIFCKGKYDGNLLAYLVCFYKGTTGQLCRIWKAAEAFEVDTYDMCERILRQLLFTGISTEEQVDVFRRYIAGGAKTEVESAFLSRCANEYFIKEQSVDGFVFLDMIRVYDRGEPLKKICKLAFLKYYAGHKEEITPRILAVIREFLKELVKEGVCFSFYRDYAKELPELSRYEDKTIVEYRTGPGSRVFIHYKIVKEQSEQNEYVQEEMQEVYSGVYTKAVVLFFGETLQYFVREVTGKTEVVTEPQIINGQGEVSGDGNSLFALINEVARGQALKEYHRVENKLSDYYVKEYVAARIFQLR